MPPTRVRMFRLRSGAVARLRQLMMEFPALDPRGFTPDQAAAYAKCCGLIKEIW